MKTSYDVTDPAAAFLLPSRASHTAELAAAAYAADPDLPRRERIARETPLCIWCGRILCVAGFCPACHDAAVKAARR